MCLAVPLKIISIKGKVGIGELLLHAGFAINKFETKEAEELLQLLREISEVSD